MTTKKRVAFLVILVGFAFSVLLLLGHRSSSLKALEAYKAQLRARGEKLTYAELMEGRKEFTNDSVAVITNAAANLRSLALIPGQLELMKPTAPGSARVCWQQEVPLTNGGTNVTWQELGEFLHQAQGDLALVRAALHDPAPDSGVVSNWFVWPRPFVAIRSTAQWLSASAVYALHENQHEAALRDLEGLASLAQVNREDPTLVSQMIRVAVAGLGLSVTWEALQSPGWTEAELERLQKAWQPIDLLQGVVQGFVGERTFGEAAFDLLRKGQLSKHRALIIDPFYPGPKSWRVDQYAFVELYRLTSMHEDELLYLQTMQNSIDSVRRLQTNSWADATADWNTNFTQLNSVSGSLKRYRYWFSSIAIPNFQKALQTAVKNQTQLQLTRTAIALQRYNLKYRKPAPDLQALVPEFLPALPRDPFSGKVLSYHNSTNGFVLYSVGEDGADDQGNAVKDFLWRQPSIVTDQ